jgi:hypothetical protein
VVIGAHFRNSRPLPEAADAAAGETAAPVAGGVRQAPPNEEFIREVLQHG